MPNARMRSGKSRINELLELIMTTSDSTHHYDGQDLPSSGPCPRQCGNEAKFREHDPSIENYIVTCPGPCGEYQISKDALEDFLDAS